MGQTPPHRRRTGRQWNQTNARSGGTQSLPRNPWRMGWRIPERKSSPGLWQHRNMSISDNGSTHCPWRKSNPGWASSVRCCLGRAGATGQGRVAGQTGACNAVGRRLADPGCCRAGRRVMGRSVYGGCSVAGTGHRFPGLLTMGAMSSRICQSSRYSGRLPSHVSRGAMQRRAAQRGKLPSARNSIML